MKEIKVTGGEYMGRWVCVESLDMAKREFGANFDPSSIRDYQQKTVEFVALGRDVYQVFDDGREELACTAQTEESAEEQAKKFNEKHPELRK